MMKEKRWLSIFLFFLLAMSLVGFSGCEEETQEQVQNSAFPLEIIGDVENPITIRALDDAPEIYEIEHREETKQVISLSELISMTIPRGNDFEVLFKAHDGFSVLISGQNLEESYLALDQDLRWEAINFKHPRSSNIKNIKNIVILSKDLPIGGGFNITEPGENIAQLSIGRFYKDGYSVFSTVRGTAMQTHDGEDYSATSYYRYQEVSLQNYVEIPDTASGIVFGNKGEEEPLAEDGRFILRSNHLSYMQGDQILIPETRGIVLNPPQKRITHVYDDTKTLLDEGEKVLLILVDGLGYHQFEYARANGYVPFLDDLPEPEMAMVTYPPVTVVNVASSLTGEIPAVHGVYRRGIRRAEVPTIFSYTEEQGKSATAIIGPMTIIELEIDPVFTVRTDDEGRNDHIKTENALERIHQGYDLFHVHLKDVDRAGHNYGDLSQKTLEEIQRTDSYIERLVAEWDGKVLIYADHGMHSTEDGGDHRHLIYEDMFMPYWLFDGGMFND